MPGELLVRFRAGAATAKTVRAEMFIIESGRQIPIQVERLSEGPEIVEGLRLARVAPDDTGSAIEALRARPDVLYAEPNFKRYKDAVPNDPRYGEQWALKNTGQLGGMAGADIKAEQAWGVTTGSRSVVVAVIDQGIDINHPDLTGNIWRNPSEIPGNGIDDDGNGYVDDMNGYDFFHNDSSVYDGPGTNPDGSIIDLHGTHVAGTIGATGNNSIGVVGVNWQISLMSLKFLGPNGGSTADLLKALGYAKMMRDRWVSSGGILGADVRVTNNSYGGGGYSQAEFDAIQAIGSSGILFVASAGNDAQDNNRVPAYPASYDLSNVISVAATDRLDNLASFSNKGTRSVHLGAPGVSILSTTPSDSYSLLNGTSMASPHVAGVAALVLAAHPEFSLERLRAALFFGGEVTSSLRQTTITGRRLSAVGSLQNSSEIDTTPPATITDFRVSAVDGRRVTLNWTAPGDDLYGGRASLYEIRFVNSNTGAEILLDALHPQAAGSAETADVSIPYQHTSGALTLRAVDKAGNKSVASANASVIADAADPYVISETPAAPLSTGGTPLHANFDDSVVSYSLPFNFPFFERYASAVYLSTNGTIYASSPPGNDAASSAGGLAGFQMIAGLWDDLDLRTVMRVDADIYVLQPDSNSVIFRWQGVLCNPSPTTAQCTGGDPVNFEIELRRDGTIVTRYGSGNTHLHPVVGISGGEHDPYVIASHTSELTVKDLTNAPTVTYTLRSLAKSANLRVSTADWPNPVIPGQNITYTVKVSNDGPDRATGVILTDVIPGQSVLVSCTAGSGACAGVSNGFGILTARLGSLEPNSSSLMTIVVSAPTYQIAYVNHAAVSSFTYDPDPSSDSFDTTTRVFQSNPTPLTGMTSIAAGYSHYLALSADGSVLAWGTNNFGQLGDGTTRKPTIPVWTKGLNGVKTIRAGGNYSVAVKSNGTVSSWGYNAAGQLGDGSTTNRLIPVKVNGLTGVKDVSAGNSHTLALKSDGTLWAWGNNSLGQLGDGTASNTNRLTPGQVAGLTDVTEIAAGQDHSVAVRSDGTVWTWGPGFDGELGNGNSGGFTPSQVNGLTGVKKVAAGVHFTLVLKNDGTVWSFGFNRYGQLGDGTTTSRSTPVPVIGLSNIVAIVAGSAHSLALASDGSIWAWGDNNWGQLGVDSNTQPVISPIRTAGLSRTIAISAGGDDSMALTSDGTVFRWGFNDGDYGSTPYAAEAAIPRQTLASPVFNPEGGTYATALHVTVSATVGAAIHYTTNGSDPTDDDPIVNSGGILLIDSNTTLKAIAFRDGFAPSGVKAATYTVTFPNAIDDSRNFVRQHYLDFLSREPDQGGWDYWTGQISQCGIDALCIHTKRIDVSAAFFIELEFQQTGSVVYRMYRAAYGTMTNAPTRANVSYSQFIADRAQLVGGSGLPQSTINFANNFVQRPEFKTAYPDAMTPTEFVNKLFDTANLIGPANAFLRQTEIDALTNNSKTRAQVLLDVIEVNEFKTREYNPSFVLMEYFGYLRRDADQDGYDFWLNVLSNKLPIDPSGYRAMVCAFITSTEYQQRFGSSITRSNRDCSQ